MGGKSGGKIWRERERNKDEVVKKSTEKVSHFWCLSRIRMRYLGFLVVSVFFQRG